MDWYDDPENARTYIEMGEGFDGAELIAELVSVLPQGARVLELGMGPGTDLDLLAKHFPVTGSDLSAVFLDRYRETHPDADLLRLDAVTIATDRRFDGLYTNKVLHHLDDADLAASFARQHEVLTAGGWMLHSFWTGEGTEEMEGMFSVYRQPDDVAAMLGDGWEDVETTLFAEMQAEDSFFVRARRAG